MQTVTIISSLIGAMALIAGSQTYWMSRQLDAFGGRIDQLDRGLNARIDQLDRSLNARIDQLDRSLNARIDQLDHRMDQIVHRMDQLDGRMDQLDGRMDTLTQRLDHQSDVILREHGERLARLEAQGD